MQHTATHCNTLQHTATHCDRYTHLPHTATGVTIVCCAFPPRYTATPYNTLQHTVTHSATYCNRYSNARCIWLLLMSMFAITHCKTLEHTLQRIAIGIRLSAASDFYRSQWLLQHTATHFNTLHYTLQRIATGIRTSVASDFYCDTLQHTATHCNTLQHTLQYIATGIRTPAASNFYPSQRSLQHTATHCNTLCNALQQVFELPLRLTSIDLNVRIPSFTFTGVTWHFCTCRMTHSYFRHQLFVCVTWHVWLIHVCD